MYLRENNHTMLFFFVPFIKVLKQEGEPCGYPYGIGGYPQVHNCAAGLECKPRGYSMICVRIEPGM